MKRLCILVILLSIMACNKPEKNLTAQHIIDKAINNSCNGNCQQATIDFTFRDRCYVSTRSGGVYQFERISTDSTGVTRDILTNEGFTRYKNDTLIKVSDSLASLYANSVNSVHYFAQLPYGLNAKAVQKELLGEATIKGAPYFEIGVTFFQENGGVDFEDEFVYWIHKENFTVDYLAYSYATNGGGIRFREAYNIRQIAGIRFVDYNNYKPNRLNIPLTKLDSLFEQGKLKLLSKIETESVGVAIPPN